MINEMKDDESNGIKNELTANVNLTGELDGLSNDLSPGM